MEYSAMLVLNQNNWDIPLGMGWITVVALLIAGSASFWFGGRRQESPELTVERPESVFGVPPDSFNQ